MRTIWWEEGLKMIDQTLLPEKLVILEVKTIRQLVEAIQSLRVRGAPALGAAGGYGVALAAQKSTFSDSENVIQEMEMAGEMIRQSRPTAINLAWGVDRVLRAASRCEDADEVRERALLEAEAIAEEDLAVNRAIGKNGARLLEDGDRVLTHCNAGRLACVGYGTALGVIRSAVAEGKDIQVYACETRPLHQGSRLTSWELSQDGIPVTLICDSVSGYLMRKGKIDKAIVGADRITSDAVFNKIGTYSHAVLARFHQVPFYVAAPLSTFDRVLQEADVTVEERDPDEVRRLGTVQLAPRDVEVYNPAFDATPLEYVSALITEKGIFRPPLMPPV
ncbi:MAG: S-methyl-5-thioribose-1-phosphate isomerase [Methanosarcinales archaeon]|nr:S-methyl-5-thioribose-1-phosphate isomerase [Methanosarcinales archaeon]